MPHNGPPLEDPFYALGTWLLGRATIAVITTGVGRIVATHEHMEFGVLEVLFSGRLKAFHRLATNSEHHPWRFSRRQRLHGS